MTIWQIAAGSDQRDYLNEFLEKGIAFVGGNRQIASLGQVEPGDLMVLKRGTSKIEAIGEVVERHAIHSGKGDKHWLKDFDGWDLSAYVYVDWRKPISEIDPTGLTRGTISRIKQEHFRIRVQVAFAQSVPVKITSSDPPSTDPVTDDQILSLLISRGLSPRLAEELTIAFARVRRLAKYYRDECKWEDVREHETRTFLVVPLLQALGWAEQQIKIELAVPSGRIDLACFRKPYRRCEGQPNDSDCELIIETKGFSQGLNLAPDQVRRYGEFFPSAKALVVTNGYCYKVYGKFNGAISTRPTSYLNLLDPRDRYPLDPENTAGCLAVLSELLPS